MLYILNFLNTVSKRENVASNLNVNDVTDVCLIRRKDYGTDVKLSHAFFQNLDKVNRRVSFSDLDLANLLDKSRLKQAGCIKSNPLLTAPVFNDFLSTAVYSLPGSLTKLSLSLSVSPQQNLLVNLFTLQLFT